jgi:O-antigen/teichoic acid export membrane protein
MSKLGSFLVEITAKGSFAHNLAITFSGNAVAQLIGFCFTPFIARLYGPEAYGLFALFVGIANNISPLATLQLPSGYVVATDQKEFANLVKLTLLILLAVTSTLITTVAVLNDFILEFFDVPELDGYLPLLPMYLFLMGLDYIMLGWTTREKKFRDIAKARLVSIFFSKVFTVVFALVAQPLAIGMIVGNLLNYPINSIGLARLRVIPILTDLPKLNFDGVLVTLRKYINYPLYLMPAVFVSGLSNQLPIYFFSVFYSPSSLGHFALANGVISAPLSIIVTSSSVVFLQKAAETYAKSSSLLGEIVLRLYHRMLLITTPPLIAMSLSSKWLFTLVFGSEWAPAGTMAAFISLSVLPVVSGPLSSIYRIVDRQRLEFSLNVMSLFLKASAILVGIYYDNIIIATISYCFASYISAIVSILVVFRLLSIKAQVVARDSFLGILMFIVVIFLYCV